MSWDYLIDNGEGESTTPASSEYSAEARRWFFIEQHKDALIGIARKLGLSTDAAFSMSVGWGRAIVDHVRAGGRVVFIDANGRERVLKVEVKP